MTTPGSRQSIARDVLAGLPQISHPSSYFVWLPLPEDARADRIAASLTARAHLGLHRRTVCRPAPVPQAIRLALGSVARDTLRTTLGTVRQEVEADALL